ncbi:Protein of unknown function (DUF3500) [Prauserella aidingensis]|uniref:DUF3500 domain-containing protein n=1 Tax=Prauserella aidingensis TaxID=387890 RepID=UPI0020A30450|nr:DUF3500 domain-containing protein [Prauserella aidingensis]MCP2256129.1 Protein of unknown function (DUF3500) [Prauserella aidingensis]
MSSGSYRGYRPRPADLPLKRGAVDFTDEAGVAAISALIGDAALPPVAESAAEPFVGITTDGTPVPGLFGVADETAPTTGALDAAQAYLSSLDRDQRGKAVLPVDAPEWQMWINAFLTFPEHGLLLQELGEEQRDAALAIVAASLSADGFAQAREAMRLNGALGEFVGGYDDTLTEYCYWFTIFGRPSDDGPWGWQLQGHHVDLHCFLLGSQMILTPKFLGVEFHGDRIFTPQREAARELMASLQPRQRDRALLSGSMLADDLPPELAGMVDGRHRAGAGRDNLVLPYEGLAGDQLGPGQRELLMSLAATFLTDLPDGPRAHRIAQIERHLDETHLAWIGTWGEAAPFYYRLHNPVLLAEYDNHAGIFLDNAEPEPFHVHTIVRTPNGGDYGTSLLRQHYAAHHH